MAKAPTQLADALAAGDQSLVLWAESPEEARNFISKAKASKSKLKIDKIFVAKKSAKVRHNHYTGGEYYPTTNDAAVDTYDSTVLAPAKIIDLVQWCTCDIMLSIGSKPIIVIEDTTHIVRMNVYQRFPRLLRAAYAGVPSIVLQGTRGLNFGAYIPV